MIKEKIIKLIVGTNNPGKLREIKDLLPSGIKIYSPKFDISNMDVQNVKDEIPKYLTIIEGNMMNFYKNLKKEFSL